MIKNIERLQKKTDQPVPSCLSIMEPEIVEYHPGKSLTLSFPVLDMYLNGNKVMQGGFIAAAFDNVFGVLSFLEKENINMSTIDLQVNYHRPLTAGDRLVITAYLKHSGNTILGLYAECFNSEGKLAATATTNIILA